MAVYSATVTSGDVAATLSDFPAYIDISSLSFTQAQANSIRVYTDSGLTTQIPREIVSTDTVFTKITSLTTSTVLYLDVDGVSSDYAVGDTYGRNNVWSDYVAVLHMDDASGGLTNATGKGDMTENGSPLYAQTGEINDAVDFDASTDYYTGTPTGTDTTEPVTVQAIVNGDTQANQAFAGMFGSAGSSQMGILVDNDGGTYGYANAYANGNAAVSTTEIGGSFQLVHAVFASDSSRSIYVDGTSEDTNTTSSTVSSTTTFTVGRRFDDQYFGGLIDEVRLRNSALSSDWITTENNNLMDNAGFWTLAEVADNEQPAIFFGANF